MAARALIFSILIVPLLLARWAARSRNPRRGARLAALLALGFGAFYVLALHFLYFKLL